MYDSILHWSFHYLLHFDSGFRWGLLKRTRNSGEDSLARFSPIFFLLCSQMDFIKSHQLTLLLNARCPITFHIKTKIICVLQAPASLYKKLPHSLTLILKPVLLCMCCSLYLISSPRFPDYSHSSQHRLSSHITLLHCSFPGEILHRTMWLLIPF